MNPLTDKAAAEAFTKKNRHVPHSHAGGRLGREASLTISWPGSTQGKPQCQGETTESGSNFTWFHQCARQGRTQTADGMWWCGIHEPAAVAARAAKTTARQQAGQAKWAASYEASRRASQVASDYPRLLAALREIADGHNDARGLAAEVLASLSAHDTTS